MIGVDWVRPVKIGVASDVSRRLDRLQAGNHLQLTTLWQSELLDDPFAVESMLHNAYEPHRIRGEWFSIPDFSSDAIVAAVAGARAAARLFPEPDAESRAAVSACLFLLGVCLRQGMGIEEAIGSVAASSGLGRSTVWALRYRPPTQIMIMPYARIVADLWRVLGRPEFDHMGIPRPEDVTAAVSAAEAAIRTAQGRT